MWTNYQLVDAGGETDVLPNYDLHAFGLYAQPGPAVDIDGTSCPATDQRGVTRPQGASCDAGAYEATFADLTITAVGVPQQVTGGDPLRYSLVVRNEGPTTSVTPQLSMVESGETLMAIPSMGGSPCQYQTCNFGPLASGASATIDIEQPTTNSGQPHVTSADWQVFDAGKASAWNIDPNAGNSKATVAVTVVPKLAPSPQAATGRCAGKKRGTSRADTLVGTPGGDTLLGLAGDDKLMGLAGDDCLDGGPGNDKLTGGRGKDALKGGPGNDVLLAADGKRDLVNCGKGRDRATVDRIDRVRGCESVTRKR
jgi:hypothetical protein